MKELDESPSEEQLRVLSCEAAKVLMAGGEGAGKTWTAAFYGLVALHWGLQFGLDPKDKQPRFRLLWIIGEDFEDAFHEFEILYGFCDRLDIVEPRSHRIRKDGKDTCEFRTVYGQLIKTISGKDPTKVGRYEPDIIIGSEASRWSLELWRRVMGRLARRQHWSRGFFSGSFETSQGPFADYYAMGQGANALDLRSYSVASWTNFHVYPGGYDDPAIVALRESETEERFLERYGGLPAPPRNAVLPDFNTILHVDDSIDYIEGEDTYLFVDPGEHVYAVLFVQFPYGECHIIDEIYAHRSTHELVIDEAKNRRGWKFTNATRRVIIDVAGFQKHASDSPAKIWQELTGYWVSGERVRVETSVQRVRSLLGISPLTNRPRLRIHPRCKGIISEGGGCPSPVPGGGVWLRHSEAGKPQRKNDHSWKALAYGLVALYGMAMPSGGYYEEDYDSRNDGYSYLGWKIAQA